MYVLGLAGHKVCLLVVRGLGQGSTTSAMDWTIGSMLNIYRVMYDITANPICYALVSGIPASEPEPSSAIKMFLQLGRSLNLLCCPGEVMHDKLARSCGVHRLIISQPLHDNRFTREHDAYFSGMPTREESNFA